MEGLHGGRRRPPAADEEGDERPRAGATAEPFLDPLLCQLAVHGGLLPAVAVPPALASPASLREDLQQLLNGMTRRTAWGGDRRKGSARIELSEGALAGATLVVHADQREVRVELELPAGSGAADWQQRIAERLEERGFDVRSVSVG